MPNVEEDESRENRIAMEIIVDAYNDEEHLEAIADWDYWLGRRYEF
ncbi:hypothetical protein [Coleofasciculus sp. H7-2]